MKRIIVLLALLLAAPCFAEEVQSPHYCNDEAEWTKWRALISKYPTDDPLWSAYALRVGLCDMVIKEEIGTDRAITLFDRYLNALKNRAANLELQEALKKKGSEI